MTIGSGPDSGSEWTGVLLNIIWYTNKDKYTGFVKTWNLTCLDARMFTIFRRMDWTADAWTDFETIADLSRGELLRCIFLGAHSYSVTKVKIVFRFMVFQPGRCRMVSCWADQGRVPLKEPECLKAGRRIGWRFVLFSWAVRLVAGWPQFSSLAEKNTIN